MGLYITGELLPHEVTHEQWERAYLEVLQLVSTYDFLDIIHDKDKYAEYGLVWSYAEKSKEREIDGDLGVSIYGAYDGCIRAEDQILYRDLSKYLPKYRNSDEIVQPEPDTLRCHDAYLPRLWNYHDELHEYQDYSRTIFGNKTQGYPHHVPLLAICLLLEDRLGNAFTVHGDITRGQINAAIEWANTIIDEPITIPCAMNNARLYERLQAFVPRQCLLESFMEATFCVCDETMYLFLQEHFSEKELADYWKERFSDVRPGTLGSSRVFKEYLTMTDDLRLLTKICADKYSPEEFAKEVASSRVFEHDKNIDDPIAALSHDSDRETPETIENVMAKTYALLGAGFPRNSAVARYIPIERGIRDIALAYDDISVGGVDFEALLGKAIEEATPRNEHVSEYLGIFDELMNLLNERTEQIDIVDCEDLVFYESGHTLEAGIKATLKKIREVIDAQKEECVQDCMENEAYKESLVKKSIRMPVIIKHCTRLLPKSNWDMFERRIEEDDFFITLLGLLSLKSDTLPMGHYVRGLLYNPILFERVLMSDDVDWLTR